MTIRVLHGDCLAVMPTLAADSFDAVVTDPPYHLTTGKKGGTGMASLNPNSPAGRSRIGTGFMGKAWDGGDVAFRPETWAEVLRVLKPGGHMLCFGGTRTFHRMVCAIEDAGFEVRDQLCWLFGSGFPKSHDVSKAIDRAAGVKRTVIGRRTDGPSSWMLDQKIEHRANGGTGMGYADGSGKEYDITAPALPESEQWSGWGTALKPAHEPICLARKPLDGTVAANVLKHGVGGLNIDACRVAINPSADSSQLGTMNRSQRTEDGSGQTWGMSKVAADVPQVVRVDGRWPANVVLSVPEDEYLLRSDVTNEQKKELFRWLHENA